MGIDVGDPNPYISTLPHAYQSCFVGDWSPQAAPPLHFCKLRYTAESRPSPGAGGRGAELVLSLAGLAGRGGPGGAQCSLKLWVVSVIRLSDNRPPLVHAWSVFSFS